MERTHTNGELRLSDTGKEVTLLGWVAKRRNFGALVFIDLRDRTGITQLVFDETLAEQIKDVRNEYILQVSGTVLGGYFALVGTFVGLYGYPFRNSCLST